MTTEELSRAVRDNPRDAGLWVRWLEAHMPEMGASEEMILFAPCMEGEARRIHEFGEDVVVRAFVRVESSPELFARWRDELPGALRAEVWRRFGRLRVARGRLVAR